MSEPSTSSQNSSNNNTTTMSAPKNIFGPASYKLKRCDDTKQNMTERTSILFDTETPVEIFISQKECRHPLPYDTSKIKNNDKTDIENEAKHKKSFSPNQSMAAPNDSWDTVQLTRRAYREKDVCTISIEKSGMYWNNPRTEVEKSSESQENSATRALGDSWSSVDLTRRNRNRGDDTFITQQSSGLLWNNLTTSKKDKKEKLKKSGNSSQENSTNDKSTESHKGFASESYDSVILTRKFRKEDESSPVSFITNLIALGTPENNETLKKADSKILNLSHNSTVSVKNEQSDVVDDPESNTRFGGESWDTVNLETVHRSSVKRSERENEDISWLIGQPEKRTVETTEVTPKIQDDVLEDHTTNNEPSSRVVLQQTSQESRKKANTKYVTKPAKKIDGEALQRPLPKELYWYNPNVSGTATEIFDMIFPLSSKCQTNYCPWTHGNFSAPADQFRELEEKRQKILRSYTGKEEEELRRRKQQRTLESLQNLLWLVHSQKEDAILEKTCKLMIQNFSCRIDKNQRLKILCEEDLSLVWNVNIEIENSSILSQREKDWLIRPVYIDGLSLLDSLYPNCSKLPILPTNVLLEVLLHFILDGHKAVVYLPDFYQSNNAVDDPSVIKFLCNSELLTFVNKRNRKAVEQQILLDAENSCGIIVSASENLTALVTSSIRCFPALNKYSDNGYMVNTFFFTKDEPVVKSLNKDYQLIDELSQSEHELSTKLDSKDSEAEENDKEGDFVDKIDICTKPKQNIEAINEDSHLQNLSEKSEEGLQNKHEENVVDEAASVTVHHRATSCTERVDIESDAACSLSSVEPEVEKTYQELSQQCRLYSQSDKAKIDPSHYQMTLKLQVFLISSLVNLTTFHFQRQRQIQIFLITINRFVPEILPSFMQKSAMTEISITIQKLRAQLNLQNWPIFSNL